MSTWTTKTVKSVTVPWPRSQRPKFKGGWRLRNGRWERSCVLEIPELTSDLGGGTTVSIVMLGPKVEP